MSHDSLKIGQILDSFAPVDEMPPQSAGYALPDATLRLLGRLIEAGAVRNVFEFGSGRSTKLFLDAGCSVTALEDSPDWLDRTLASLTPEARSRLHAICQPLRFVLFQGAPFRSWTPDRDTLARLESADLILIDAPAFPPFREHALSISLQRGSRALIVVDDAGIPTVSRFCLRMAAGPRMLHWRSTIDHGLFLFMRTGEFRPACRRGLVETAKAWRRFFMAGRMR